MSRPPEPTSDDSRRTLPPNVAAAINFAFDLERRGLFEDAIATLRSALGHAPGEREIEWRLALMLLREGEFAEGWRLFEQRPIEMGGRAAGKPVLTFPEWTGAPISSLLILPEQGLGDQIMLARYAPFLQRRGMDVTLMCHPALARLFARLGVRVLSALGRVALPPCQAWALAPSLPLRVGEIPAEPYLPAAAGGQGIGLLAQGNPGHVNDLQRSLPADLTAELAAWPQVRSLGRDAIGANDLEDTARVIETLDLVISVDTAVAHLAGAMGKPCWLLLPYVPDWRWQRNRADSPWYPTMRIFRQPRLGDWASVIAAVRQALAERPGLAR